MWVLDHLADIASDLSAIHGIRDANRLEAAVFFPLVARLAAYDGVICRRVTVQAAPKPEKHRPPQAAPPLTPEVLAGINARLASVGQQPIGYQAVTDA